MTIGDAKKLLRVPVFGNRSCIQAVALLELSDELAVLKEQAEGRGGVCDPRHDSLTAEKIKDRIVLAKVALENSTLKDAA